MNLPPADGAPIADWRKRAIEAEARAREADELLDAIRSGHVDAVVVGGDGETQVYTLENADRPYRLLIEQMQEGAVTVGADGIVLYCNERLAGLLGRAREQIVGSMLADYAPVPLKREIRTLIATGDGAGKKAEAAFLSSSGTVVPVQLSFVMLPEDAAGSRVLCGVVTDLSEQKAYTTEITAAHARLTQEIAERERAEEALRQSQKMEAVGQLTGGLAHDFNNLLAGISGSLELMQTRMQQGRFSEVDRYMAAAQGAAKRAASLTHRLLAFSRRQTLAPKLTDVNRLVGGMQEMIQRAVGPGILIEVVVAPDLWPALVDGPQLENALLNLCINARDAMPEGGRITIETANRSLDPSAARSRNLPEGQYLSLSVTDTGTGMPPEVVARVFEPFFTTKPIGEGTGLGLSMIYGFAQQSGGQVRIYSEPLTGTTVSLYLPRHDGPIEHDDAHRQNADLRRSGQGETVLVVDDEPTVRMLITDILDELGYRSIEAGDSATGLKLLQSDARIDLLVTDVGLPGGMNGRQMADAGRISRPDLRVLFITGYAENAILSHGHLAPGMAVLTKPFPIEAMATRIRTMIG